MCNSWLHHGVSERERKSIAQYNQSSLFLSNAVVYACTYAIYIYIARLFGVRLVKRARAMQLFSNWKFGQNKCDRKRDFFFHIYRLVISKADYNRLRIGFNNWRPHLIARARAVRWNSLATRLSTDLLHATKYIRCCASCVVHRCARTWACIRVCLRLADQTGQYYLRSIWWPICLFVIA